MQHSVRTLINSFRFAIKGFRYAFVHEQNFRIQTLAAIVVFALAFFFHVKPWEVVALTGMVVAVLVLEIANTVIEKFVDLLKPRMEHYSGVVKDLMATAVLLTSLGAIIVGSTIFIPYIVHMISEMW